MKTIDSLDLDLVTGGKSHPLTSIGGDTAATSSSDALLSTLQGIQSSLKDLNKNQGGLFGGNSGLLFMTMALAMSRRNDNVYVVGGGGGPCWGHRFRAWW